MFVSVLLVKQYYLFISKRHVTNNPAAGCQQPSCQMGAEAAPIVLDVWHANQIRR